MKKGVKILVNAVFYFGAITFLTYLFLIISGYFGCCLGLSEMLYDKIVLIVVVCAAITLGFCILNNCIKISKKKPGAL
jgi:uncharacterized membrane protein